MLVALPGDQEKLQNLGRILLKPGRLARMNLALQNFTRVKSSMDEHFEALTRTKYSPKEVRNAIRSNRGLLEAFSIQSTCG